MIGIYQIKNLTNNKCYYGSSKNIEKRWERHKKDLIKNIHHNTLLQRAWNKHGSDSFIFEMVEECNINDLLIIEQKYLDTKPAYNIGLVSSGGDNITNNPKRLEIIEKMTNSINNRISLMTDEERIKKYSHPKDKNPNWKGGSSIKYCECGKIMGYNSTSCNDCRNRNGENNSFFGKKHTNEYKINASKRQIGIYNGNQNKPVIINLIEYRSAGEASKKLNISMVTIRWRCLSNNEKFISYQYKVLSN